MGRQPVPVDGLPGLAAVGGAQECAAARRVRAVSSGAERPALAAEVPGAGEDYVRILRIHRQARAARRSVSHVAEDEGPGLAAIGGSVDAALLAVAPELARDARIDDVGAPGMHDDPRDPLGLGQPHVRPGLARVRGLVDAVADGDGIARPGFSGTDPHRARVSRVDGDGSDGLYRLLVEDGHEAGAAVLALPDAATGGADVDQRLAVDVRSRKGGNAATHGCGPDVARV